MVSEKESLLTEYVSAFQKEDLSSFSLFFEETKRPLFYNIYALTRCKEESEDLLQETYVRFLENIKKVRLDRSILGYLMVLSRNLALDHLRKKKHDSLSEDVLSVYGTRDHYQDEREGLLERIQAILKEKEFEVFVLRAMDDLSFKEIAKLKRRPLGTVLWLYQNALKKIRKEIPYESL